MLTVIIVIHLMLVLGLIGVVLLQKSEGGGLVSSTSGFMTGRGTANVLTRTTALLAVGFFITSLALSWLAGLGPPPGIDHQYRGRLANAGGARRRAGAAGQAAAAFWTSCSRAEPRQAAPASAEWAASPAIEIGAQHGASSSPDADHNCSGGSFSAA